jgi:hypothetical protein
VPPSVKVPLPATVIFWPELVKPEGAPRLAPL